MSATILIAPLDWGLGHATRCIPIISRLLDEGHNVILGGSGRSLDLLRSEFPQLQSMSLPDYGVTYSAKGSALWSITKQAPKVLSMIKREHKYIMEHCDPSKIDLILSDNRYGVHHPDIPSYFIGHQVHVKAGGISAFVNTAQRRYIYRFDGWLIPDTEESPGLSGKLAHPPTSKIPSTYIGPLSRFERVSSTVEKGSVLMIVSGPPPRSHAFANLLVEQAELLPEDRKLEIIVGWKPEDHEIRSRRVEITYMPSVEDMQSKISSAEIIVCRSGYSSIMDMARMGKHPITVPTPGQTEQEYLGKLHNGRHCLNYGEDELDLEDALDEWRVADLEPWPARKMDLTSLLGLLVGEMESK